MTKSWDEREKRMQERDNHIKRAGEMIRKFVPVAEKYAKLNGIELPDGEDTDHHGEYLEIMYGFLYDAKFIDFALDECGIIFNEEMFTLEDEFTDEDLKKYNLEDYEKNDKDN